MTRTRLLGVASSLQRALLSWNSLSVQRMGNRFFQLLSSGPGLRPTTCDPFADGEGQVWRDSTRSTACSTQTINDSSCSTAAFGVANARFNPFTGARLLAVPHRDANQDQLNARKDSESERDSKNLLAPAVPENPA